MLRSETVGTKLGREVGMEAEVLIYAWLNFQFCSILSLVIGFPPEGSPLGVFPTLCAAS
jgi:hypothetical protein